MLFLLKVRERSPNARVPSGLLLLAVQLLAGLKAQFGVLKLFSLVLEMLFGCIRAKVRTAELQAPQVQMQKIKSCYSILELVPLLKLEAMLQTRSGKMHKIIE